MDSINFELEFEWSLVLLVNFIGGMIHLFVCFENMVDIWNKRKNNSFDIYIFSKHIQRVICHGMLER